MFKTNLVKRCSVFPITVFFLLTQVGKIEKDIYVDLSARQRTLYKALLAKVSVADLLAKAANIGDADSARSLMNLVMQFRKVRFIPYTPH